MSRGNRKSFPDRLKRWLKLDSGNVLPDQRISLTEELSCELGVESPTPTRMKAIKELDELLSVKILEEFGIEKVWCLVKDLLSEMCPAEQRHTTLQMLTTLVSTHENLGVMRQVFFEYISKNYQHEEIEHMFRFFCAVIGKGKKIEHIEESVGMFLLEWLPAVLEMPQAVDGLNLVNTLVKFNSAFLDEPVVVGFVMRVVSRLLQARDEEEAVLCLQVLESIIAYSSLPSSALSHIIYALTRLVNVPQITKLTYKILIQLFGTHHGRNGLYVLCQMIHKMSDPHIVRGAIFFLASVLWGSNRIPSLDCSPAVVLPTFYQVSQNSHILVVFEVVLSIQKLLAVKADDMHLSSWSQLLGTLANVFRHTVCLEDGEERDTIMNILSNIMDYIEELVDTERYYGLIEEFHVLVTTYAQYRPVDSVLKVLNYQAKNILPVDPNWQTKLGTLFSVHYHQGQRLGIRMKALDILSKVFIHYRDQHGIELVRDVVLVHLDGVEREAQVKIRKAAVKLLCKIVMKLHSDITLSVLYMLEKVMMAPYKRGNSVVLESEAADIVEAVDNLVLALKIKMWELPSSHAIYIFKILLSCLEHHYQNKILQNTTIRFTILEMILEMRINENYQIGFIKNELRDVGRSPSSISKYSPFIILDHIHSTDLEEETLQAAAAMSLEENETTPLSLAQATSLLVTALKKEKDWAILSLILKKLSKALQNKVLVIGRDRNEIVRLISALISMIDDRCLDLPASLYNTPAKFNQSLFQRNIFQVLAKLVPHHMHFDYSIQRKVIRCLSVGVINQYSGPLCISTITMCVLEMQDSMLKVVASVINSFSRMSATVPRARAMMEFLSTLLHFPNVYSNFVANQYKLIFAIAIHYTNPTKFNHYIVSLAYHVIAMWFLKCRLPYRISSVTFITQHLNAILKNMATIEVKTSKDSKPTKVKGKKSAQGKVHTSEENKHKNMEFFSDLRETCLDLMSRYTYGSCPSFQKRMSTADMWISGQSRSWLMGTKIITIKTSGCEQIAVQNGLCIKCLQICCAQNFPESSRSCKSTSDKLASESSCLESVSSPGSSACQSPISPISDLPHSSLASDSFPTSPLNRGAKSKSSSMSLFSTSEELAGDGVSPSSDHQVFSQSETAQNSSSLPKPTKCVCWCQGWAEITIKQPTGNTSWMVRVQSEQPTLTTDSEVFLYDQSEMYPPPSVKDKKTASRRSGSMSGTPSAGSSNAGKDETIPSMPAQRERGYTVSGMSPASRRGQSINLGASNDPKTISGGISPGFVFLQLYFHGQFGNIDDRPILLSTDQVEITRALDLIDYIKPQETHKIGVLYARKGQTTEREILSNTFGSLRYMYCISGMGETRDLRNVSKEEVFLGGLDTNGRDGEVVYVWHDDDMQVVFHIATLMPTLQNDPNCNNKKLHIGNDFVTIVFNESGVPYNINTMKGQFNHTVIEVVPGDHGSNCVSVLCRPELEEYVKIDNPRIVSDASLPILVRQLALHANFASLVWDSLSRPPHTPFASNWMERLRKIRKLREKVLNEFKMCDKGLSPLELVDFTDLIDTSVRKRTGVYSMHFMH
nr:tuberin-like isoform X2 [Procambarus clarkii]